MMCISYPRELKPAPSQRQKSFYGKALTYTLWDGTELLKSYDTIVASRTPDGTIHRHWDCVNPNNLDGGWSPTTGRHIKAFCNLSKAEFEALPLEPEPIGTYRLT